MNFVEKIQEWLRSAGRHALGSAPATTGIEPPDLRPLLLHQLAALEHAGAPESHVRKLHTRWTAANSLQTFSRILTCELKKSFGRSVDSDTLQEFVRQGFRFALKSAWDEPPPTLVHRLEIERCTEAATQVIPKQQDRFWWQPAEYAHEVGLVVGGEISRAGEMLVKLTGREALRWMLHLEIVQSTGADDRWRVSASMVEFLLDHRSCPTDADLDDARLDWAGESFFRLAAMNVLELEDTYQQYLTPWRVSDSDVALLEELVAHPPTPMKLLAQAMTRDAGDRLVLEQIPVLQQSDRLHAQAEYARAVAHEVRNALVPVQTALQSLKRLVPGDTGSDALFRRAEAGLEHLFRYARQSTELVDRAMRHAEPVFLSVVIDDALAATRAECNGRVTIEGRGDLPRLRVKADRQQLVSAFVNIIRNAAQAKLGLVQLRIHCEHTADAVTVYFDDDGPGVPEGDRESVFREGFSLRPGGSGFGLALVRAVAVDHEGTALCAESPAGGARISVTLPLVAPESP